MKFTSVVKGLYNLGFENLYLSVKYSFVKKSIEKGLGPKEFFKTGADRRSVGALKKVENIASGALLKFANAELEIVFLASDLVRLTWHPGLDPVPYAIEKNDWPACSPAIKRNGEACVFSTPEMTLIVNGDGTVEMNSGDGRNLVHFTAPEKQGDLWRIKSGLREEEHIFGMGQRNRGFNLRGGSYLTWNSEAMGQYDEDKDPIYLSVPAYTGLHNDGSYMAFFENSFPARFTFKEEADIVFSNGALRCYLIPGPVNRCIDRFTELTGRPNMPPRWALGYHQCRWSYRNEAEVMEIADGFRAHKLPLDTIHLDIHYMDGYRVFTVDKKSFPDLRRLSDTLAERGIKLVTILDPGVKFDKDYEVYQSGCEHEVFCKLPDGREIHGPVWPGDCAFPDFTRAEVRKWWSGYYKRFVEWGIAGVWHDMNEPAVFSIIDFPTLPANTLHGLEGRGGDHREAHNVYGMLENRAGYEGLKAARPEKRPWLLTRSGWAGIQRYAWNWTGDCNASWWAMKHNIRLALMLGVSGVPYTGSDIGGFNDEPTPELYARWFQMASFMPFFRTHSANFVKRREPWSYGDEITGICRRYLELRYALLPYWYTLARQAHGDGRPLLRPLWWGREAERELWNVEDQFMLGESLMVAPVVESGATSRRLRLPSGTWFDFWSGVITEGGGEIEADAPLDRIPLYVKDGSIITMNENDTLCLHVFMSSACRTAQCLLYSDEGDGYGPSRSDVFEAMRDGDRLLLKCSGEGAFVFPYDKISIVLHGLSAASAEADGKIDKVENDSCTVGVFNVVVFNLKQP